jgi:hypothetical protein
MDHKAQWAFPPSFRLGPWGIPASLALHALFLFLLGNLVGSKSFAPPSRESIPVEIWPPEQWQGLSRRPSPQHDPAPPASDLKVRPSVTIRATRILSGEALAHPGSRRMRQTLGLMEEETRLEQLCNIEAMAQIAARFETFQPEWVVAYAKADVLLTDNMLIAKGAALRSDRRWYDLAYACGLSPDRQTVQSFEFSVGRAIPRAAWERHNLPAFEEVMARSHP